MTVKPIARETPSNPAAGAVVLWCILAGGAVAATLIVQPEDRRGVEFLSCVGAQRLLADLAILYVAFIVPLFAWRKDSPLRAGIEASATVLFTAAVGLVLVDNLVGLGAGHLAGLIGFVVLASAAAVAWAEALRAKPAAYYGAAAMLAFGAPLVRFFADETLHVRPGWLGWLSPLTAWRAIVDSGSWGPWIVFGALFAAGAVCLAMKSRRAKP